MKKTKHKRWNIKNKLLLTLFLGIILLGTVSCEKYPKPYIKKWVGTYECEEIYSYSTGPTGHQTSGTIVYQVNVAVTAKGNILVNFFNNRNEREYEAEVSSDGAFINYDGKGIGIEGSFIGDSLYMFQRHPYSQGSSSVSHFKGKKLKSK
ncbi:MAG: hypothetical protein FWC34_06125 [Bacteroidetes bacterium]|nr:hypothetical protein [Bacteroidota bacterium]MCL2302971.1 hypothetical protein [Lentimicrobiaceae bacterium]